MKDDAELLEQAIRETGVGLGSCVVQCRCGRTHFSSYALGYEEGELEDLQAKALAIPTLYLEESESDSISAAWVDGHDNVYGCPCAWEKKYATFFWNNRHMITAFIKLKATQQLNEASKTLEALP